MSSTIELPSLPIEEPHRSSLLVLEVAVLSQTFCYALKNPPKPASSVAAGINLEQVLGVAMFGLSMQQQQVKYVLVGSEFMWLHHFMCIGNSTVQLYKQTVFFFLIFFMNTFFLSFLILFSQSASQSALYCFFVLFFFVSTNGPCKRLSESSC